MTLFGPEEPQYVGWYREPGQRWQPVSQGTEQECREGLERHKDKTGAKVLDQCVAPKGVKP